MTRRRWAAGEPFFFDATKIRIGRGRSLPLRNQQAKPFSPASIPKSGPEIKNHCTKEGVNGEKLTSIRKFGLEIKNRCTHEGINRQNPTSIRKFGLEIKNRCTVCPCFDLLSASIRKSGPEIENQCSAIVPASRMARLQQSLPPRCCVRFKFSSSQSRTLPPAAPSCRQIERPAYSSRCRYDAASDSIFFVAAK